MENTTNDFDLKTQLRAEKDATALINKVKKYHARLDFVKEKNLSYKNFDVVKTPRGAIAFVNNINANGLMALTFMSDFNGNQQYEKPAWWSADDGLIVIGSLNNYVHSLVKSDQNHLSRFVNGMLLQKELIVSKMLSLLKGAL